MSVTVVNPQDKYRVSDSHEKTRAAAAPRKPKNGAVSSPLNVDDICGRAMSQNNAGRSTEDDDCGEDSRKYGPSAEQIRDALAERVYSLSSAALSFARSPVG